MRDIKIKKVLNGFRVKVGCQEVVFTKKGKLIKELSRYIDNPSGVTKEYLEKYKKSVNPSDIVVELSNGIGGFISPIENEQSVVDEVITGSLKKSDPVKCVYSDEC